MPPPMRNGTPYSPAPPISVLEIRSRSDNLRPLQHKMRLWMDAGARLGWLIDPYNRRVYIYRAGQPEPEMLENPATLDGEDVLPRLRLCRPPLHL